MAFILDNITTVRGQDKSPRVQGLKLYRTTDARATVLASDYFLNGKVLVRSSDTAVTASSGTQRSVDMFYAGDIISIQQVDASNNPLDNYEVVVAFVDKTSDPAIMVELVGDGELVAVGTLTDVSTASNVDISFGTNVDLTNITTYLGGAISGSNSAITTSIGGTAVLGGSLTVTASGSAEGDKDTASPYGLRTGTTFRVATDGASTGTATLTIVLRGVPVAGQLQKVWTRVPDVSTASSTGVCIAPCAGTIVRIESVLQGPITGADAVLTCSIGSTAITNGTITIANSGSAVGTLDSATPTAANVVTEGAMMKVVSDGGSTDAAYADVYFHILRS